MITKDYKQYKNQVLELYGRYAEMSADNGKEVDESIAKLAGKIKSEVFNLMVLGEAKSGKSTFINAYLGKEIVPMDVCQCTSAIIKIHHGEKILLVAKSAAGGRQEISGEEKIKAFLQQNAALLDEYRNIPVTTINNELLIKKKGKIHDNEIERFVTAHQEDNFAKMQTAQYNELIRSYIKKNKEQWGKIITEIDITYPLPEAMRDITIIDSPGVGAKGNVGSITKEYLEKADAIIFVKSLSGQAVESASFMDFVNECPEKNKEYLFLVFTGKATMENSSFLRLRENALNTYKGSIDQQKIVFVDSKVEMHLNKCLELGTTEKIGAYFDEQEKSGEGFSPVSLLWYKSYNDVTRFAESMERLSNFKQVRDVIETFARTANYRRLIDFLSSLEKECVRYHTSFQGVLDVAEKSLKDPALLERNIADKEEEIKSTYNKLQSGIQEVYARYTDNISSEGIIMQKAEELRRKYEEQLKGFRQIPEEEIKDQTFGIIRKTTMDAIEETKSYRLTLAKQIIEECNKKLIEYTNDPSKIPAEAYVPNFTEHDFDEINSEAEKQTSGYDEIEHGLTFFKTTERIPYHHLKKHVGLVLDSISDRLDEIIDTMKDNVIAYMHICRDIYAEKLTRHVEELEAQYDKLLQSKNDNDAQLKNVNDLKAKAAGYAKQATDIQDLEKELINYVGNR